MINQGDAEVDK